jgi:hypothetical protein
VIRISVASGGTPANVISLRSQAIAFWVHQLDAVVLAVGEQRLELGTVEIAFVHARFFWLISVIVLALWHLPHNG